MARPDSLIPNNDQQRLMALAPYLVLGTTPDAVFDEVVRLTAKLFNTPIALVSLVEENSVWFKANFGLTVSERVARNESVCSVAILQNETTIYEDLRNEPCHLTDQEAAEALQLRFYAGHPLLTTDGHAIGTLCVIDRQPRALSFTEQMRLQAMAGIVMKMLELRLALQQQPENSSTTWLQLYHHLDESLGRLSTLNELAQWEESPTTAAYLNYQRSIDEEATRVIKVLDTQVTDALQALKSAGTKSQPE